MVDKIKIKKKICLLGDGAVGKTSLIRRYVYNEFDDKYIRTLGAKVTKKEIDLKFCESNERPVNVKAIISVWDILGQRDETLLDVRPVYYRGTNGALIVCDITCQETFESIPEWIESLFDVVEEIPIIVIGNKIDMYRDAHVYYDDLEELAIKYEFPIFLTSARTNSNVDPAFYKLSEMMIERSILRD